MKRINKCGHSGGDCGIKAKRERPKSEKIISAFLILLMIVSLAIAVINTVEFTRIATEGYWVMIDSGGDFKFVSFMFIGLFAVALNALIWVNKKLSISKTFQMALITAVIVAVATMLLNNYYHWVIWNFRFDESYWVPYIYFLKEDIRYSFSELWKRYLSAFSLTFIGCQLFPQAVSLAKRITPKKKENSLNFAKTIMLLEKPDGTVVHCKPILTVSDEKEQKGYLVYTDNCENEEGEKNVMSLAYKLGTDKFVQLPYDEKDEDPTVFFYKEKVKEYLRAGGDLDELIEKLMKISDNCSGSDKFRT